MNERSMDTNIMLLFLISLSTATFGFSSYRMKGNRSMESRWPFSEITFTHPVQSPVDIVTSKSKFRALPQLEFILHLSKNVKTIVKNTGKTVYIFLNKKRDIEIPHLKGGPLSDTYNFEQLHMHWGTDDKWGSEHFIDGESYSIEGHAVHYNSKYGNMSEAMKHKDGLCVLTIFAEAYYPSNHLLEPLINVLEGISEPGTFKVIPAARAFAWFLSVSSINDFYYTYPGSLTTSPYTENVIFIVFPNPINLSYTQLSQFRTLHNDENGEYILENKRQLQPLFDRPILRANIAPRNGKRREIEFSRQPWD